MERQSGLVLKALWRWAVGLCAAVLIVSLFSRLVVNSVEPHEWDPDLEIGIRVPGTAHRHRTEGWGTSVAGQHGVFGVPDVSSLTGRKVVIWGDSYVEQLGVSDAQKVGPQLTRMLQAGGDGGVVAFGVGAGNATIARVTYLMPRYERLVESIEAHYIVLGRTHFIRSQDPPVDEHALSALPAPRLHHAPRRPRRQGLAAKLRPLGLDFLLTVYGRLPKSNLRFHLGKQELTRKPEPAAAPRVTTAEVAAWRYVLRTMRDRSGARIAFVYCPHVPRIGSGRIQREDPEEEVIGAFRSVCEEEGLAFIDLGARFRRYFDDSKRFPRGFPNGRPGQGHLNAGGIRILAEAIHAHLADR